LLFFLLSLFLLEICYQLSYVNLAAWWSLFGLGESRKQGVSYIGGRGRASQSSLSSLIGKACRSLDLRRISGCIFQLLFDVVFNRYMHLLDHSSKLSYCERDLSSIFVTFSQIFNIDGPIINVELIFPIPHSTAIIMQLEDRIAQ